MPTQNRRISIPLPASVLKDVDWLAPLEDMTRDELILKAVKRFLKPHLDIRRQVLKAAASKEPGRGPFETVEEMLTALKHELKKWLYRITKAISESTEVFKTAVTKVPSSLDSFCPSAMLPAGVGLSDFPNL